MMLSDFVLEYLANIGVKHVFVVNGAAIGVLIDAFSRTDRIRHICVQHEQAGAFAAETLTKCSNTLGVNFVTSGPGGTNLITGIANCWYDSIPNLYITGQVNSQFIRKDPSLRQVGFQENDIVSMVKPITKFACLLTDPNKVKSVLNRAIQSAYAERPGPVLIDIPIDVQKAEIDINKLEEEKTAIDAGEKDFEIDDRIDKVVERLNQSERPVVLIGGGVRLADAVEEVRELMRILRLPGFPTWNALDILTSDFEFYAGRVGTYGGPGRNFAIQNSDLLLAIGSRLSGRITGGAVSSFARKAYKIFVDIDKANLSPELQQVRADMNIRCDAKVFINKLIDKTSRKGVKSFEKWLRLALEWRDKYDPILSEYFQTRDIVNPYVFMDELSNQLDKKDCIVVDCGGNVVVTNQAFKTKMGQRLCSSNGNSPMGYAFAGAIGACFANRGGRVICLIGDGGFNMNIQELQTVKNYDLPLKVFIMNNHVYGIIKAYQDINLGSRYLGSGPEGYNPPHFLKVVEAYGIATKQIWNHAELSKKISEVIDYAGPIVCDVNMHEHYKYQPRIFGFNTPIEDMYPYLPREEFRKNLLIDPVPGWEEPLLPRETNKSME